MLTPVGISRSEYITALMNGNSTHVKLVAVGQTYGDNVDLIFTDEDIEITGGVNLNSFFNSDTDMTMGRAVMDELNVSLLRNEKTNSVEWSGDFRLDMGVEIGTDTYYVTVGYYIGTYPERNVSDEYIQFRLVDRMSLFDIPFADYLNDPDTHIGEDNPMSVGDLYHGICTYCGVTYDAGDELTAIMNRQYTSLPFSNNGLSCREVIAMIAEANCCYARINASGHIILLWYHDHMSDYVVISDNEFVIKVAEIDEITDSTLKKKWGELSEFTWEDLKYYLWGELEGKRIPFKINALSVKQMEADVGYLIPAAADRNVYLIVDNPFLKISDTVDSDTLKATYLMPIYNRLGGFGSYVPTYVQCVGNWLVEPGDVITVEVGDRNQCKMPVFTRQLSWNGGCTDTYESTGNIERVPVSLYNNKKMLEGGRMHIMRVNLDQLYSLIQNELDEYSTINQTASAITLAVGTVWASTQSAISDVEQEIASDYYKVQSGIAITQAGIDVTGQKYVKIESGGSFNVSATNFIVDSTNAYIETKGRYSSGGGYEDNVIRLDMFGLHNTVKPSGNDSGSYKVSFGTDNFVRYSGIPQINVFGEAFLFQSADWMNLFFDLNIAGGNRNNSEGFYIHNNASDYGGVQLEGYKNNKWGSNYPGAGVLGASDNYLRAVYAVTINTGGIWNMNGGYIAGSSRNIKHDIITMDHVGDKLDALRPVSFVYNSDPDEKTHFGLIYEETIEVVPEACSEEDDEKKGIDYTTFIPMLIKEIQDLRARVAELERRLG